MEKTRIFSEQGINKVSRGKIVWLNETEMQRDCPACAHLFKCTFTLNDAEISEVKEQVKACLTNKGFVFFDECVYRYKLGRNNMLKEFGINFHHIK